jgi:hypothetical protein
MKVSQDEKREAFLNALGELAHSVSKLSDVWDSLGREDRREVEFLDWHEVLQLSFEEMPSEFFAFMDQLGSVWGV